MYGSNCIQAIYPVLRRSASNLVQRMAHREGKVIRLPAIKTHGSKQDCQQLNHIGNGIVQNGHINHDIEDSVDCWDEAVCLACQNLQNHQVIAVPTDTIYGIAALAQSTQAVDQLYDIKNRDTSKPISISVGDVIDVCNQTTPCEKLCMNLQYWEMVDQHGWDDSKLDSVSIIILWGKVTISDALLHELLPGPVTVVFERTPALNPELNPGTSLVGIRVPDSGFVCDVTRACKQPLALTSANRSAGPSSLSVKEFRELWDQLSLVFDGGLLGTTPESRLGSTVVDLSVSNTYNILRPGSAYKETIEKLSRHGLQEKS